MDEKRECHTFEIKKEGMLDLLYKMVLLITFCFLLFFGLYLLFGKILKNEKLKNYLKARTLLGYAFIVFAVMYFIHWEFDLRDHSWWKAISLNLVSYYIFALLLELCFISLLDYRSFTKKKIREAIGKGGLFLFYISLFLWVENDSVCEKGLMFGALIFILDVYYIVFRIFKAYKKALSGMNNYFSDDMDFIIRWFKNSISAIILVGMSAPIITFTNKFLVTIHCFFMLFAFIYIFISFVNYGVVCSTVDFVFSDTDTSNESIKIDEEEITNTLSTDKNVIIDNRDKFNLIKISLDDWVVNKKFRIKSITIEQLATIIGTNRTYLSCYINSTFNCSFREWITKLRIEDAKELMLENPAMKITKISEQVGFLSDSHFIRQFSARENISPAKWREREIVLNTSKTV